MFQRRRLHRYLESLQKESEPDENEIESTKQLIDNIQALDVFSVAKSLLPTLLMIPVPKKYQKPISSELQRAQDLIISSNDVQRFVESQHVIRSIPRHQVDSSDADDVVSNAIDSSKKEVLQESKKHPARLEDMSRKQRRAAEYRIMREAENKTSKFISSLKDNRGMGVASVHSRQEAARRVVMSMELPDKIREKVLNKEETVDTPPKPKYGPKSKHQKATVQREKKATAQREKKATVQKEKQPIHPSWEAHKESKEKERLHIDLSAPRVNKSIIFD